MKTNKQNLLKGMTKAVFMLLVVSVPLQVSASFFSALDENEPLFYDGGVGSINFEAEGGKLEFESGGNSPRFFSLDGMNTLEIDGGDFVLGACVDSDGNLMDDCGFDEEMTNTFTIEGEYENGMTLESPLLAGHITGVMCDEEVNDGECDFLFETTGGSAYVQGLFPSHGGILLTGTNFGGWGEDFSSEQVVASVGVPVPEPTTLALLGLGLAGLGFTRRRMKS